jgi:hypothetical protein
VAISPVLLTPRTSVFSGAGGAAMDPPAEARVNNAAVDRLMRLVARVLVMVIAVLCVCGEANPNV